MRLYDAHNHLQDERLKGRRESILATCHEVGVTKLVVNGTRQQDWSEVQALARKYPQVLPSFGYHPWFLGERTDNWRVELEQILEESGGAVGEIGLDRWKPGLPYEGQEEAFVDQLRLAAKHNVPASIHCLEAWGRLYELLETSLRPEQGFILHSFGGPREMIPMFAKLGAYFSFPGYFLNLRKERQRANFWQVPRSRLLIETDAPAQPLPPEKSRFSLTDDEGRPINHPANLAVIYEELAVYLGETPESLSGQVEENFQRLFAGW